VLVAVRRDGFLALRLRPDLLYYPNVYCRLLIFPLLLGFTAMIHAHSPGEQMGEAAQRLLVSLDPAQRDRAQFEFQDPERENWHYVPRRRQGIAWKDLSLDQQPLAHALLATALSTQGILKAATIISLEEVLRVLEAGRGPDRDPGLYYLSIFGTPGPEGTWGWRVDGHHLSLNLTVIDGQPVAVTPSFFGANPATVPSGPRAGLRVLAAEEDLARQLVQSLDPDQRRIGVLPGAAPSDIILSPRRAATRLEPEGLASSQMTTGQRDALRQLIEVYVRNYRPELADADLRKIDAAGPDRIHFAWAGGLNSGEPHYYRVQGPTFILEYDNVQDGANHIHTVWRDVDNDFGADLLRQHYEAHPH
jgi:hypothetical protein